MPTRRNLVRIEIRCKEHEAFTNACSACVFVRQFESRFDELRQRRDRLVAELRHRLLSGDVILNELC
jgi:hypothetical protein